MLTVETWLQGIGLKQPIEECPAWPPDLYALAGTLIRRSGAYLEVFNGRRADYLNDIEDVAARWRRQIDEIQVETVNVLDLQAVRVKEVVNGWACLIAAKATVISDIRSSLDLTKALIRLALIADEASAGIGIGMDRQSSTGPLPSKFLSIADTVLYSNDLQSFCWEVPRDTLCVLGKQHTPLKGATFRSLSHHLALYQPSEIEARWINPFPQGMEASPTRKVLNLLLLPWPARVETNDFQYLSEGAVRADGSAPAGYFRYQPAVDDSSESFAERLTRAIDIAKKHTGSIDAIVFPELSLTKQEYNEAERMLSRLGVSWCAAYDKQVPRQGTGMPT
jgi:hypothetical protein